MSDIPETSETLIVRIKDPQDRDAWDRFETLYRPVIYRLARGRGLQDADAQDLVQQVLLAVASSVPRWERQSEDVRFRHWLRRVTKNATLNALSRGSQDVAPGGSTLMNLLRECPDPDHELDEAIEWEHRREVYRRAARIVAHEVSVSAWRVFSQVVIEGEDPQRVAERLSKSIGSIYVTRCRVMGRLRDAVKRIEEGMS